MAVQADDSSERVTMIGMGTENTQPDVRFDGPSGWAAQVALVGAAAEARLDGATREMQLDDAVAGPQPDASPALVALVGAGPGRLDLITVRGLDLLKRADVVVHDRLDTAELLAFAGVQGPAGRARLIDVGKHAGNHPVPQGRINQILIEEAKNPQVKLVVRLKGGDPYVFGRGGEEASALAAAGIPFEVVPGISSALAALSYAGVPATDRRHAASFHVLTGHRRANGPLDIDFRALVEAGGTDIFLMSVATLGDIARGLLAAGRDPETPACVVERGTSPRQRRIDGTLETIGERAREASVQSPAILVVGEVCSLASELDWFDRLPLRGCRIAVTRPADRAKCLVEDLRALGAEVIETPLIKTVPRPVGELVPVMKRLSGFSWLVLTSTEGVRCLSEVLRTAGLDARALAGLRIAAVGPATASALASLGVRADLVPQRYDTEHLARELVERIVGTSAGPIDSVGPVGSTDSGGPTVPAAGLPQLESLSGDKTGDAVSYRPEPTPTGKTEGQTAVPERGPSGLESVSGDKTAMAAANRTEPTPTGDCLATEGRTGDRTDDLTRPVLLFRAKHGSPSLPRVLGSARIPFEDVPAYETSAIENEVASNLARELLAGKIDVVTLTSPSCAHALAAALGRECRQRPLGSSSPLQVGALWPASCITACLGPSTRAAAEAHGMRCIEADQATVASLIDAIRRAAALG